MIARLHGRVLSLEADAVLLDVGGVGYRVYVPAPLVSDLGPEGAEVTVHTYLYVRENEVALYGATDPAAVELFVLLLGVSGVGPRLAMAMLSTLDAAALQSAIVGEDIPSLTRVSGVGKKTAQRLILDLKGPLEKLGVQPGVGAALAEEDEEAVAALTSLGYTTGEARRALAEAECDDDAPLEERIMAALKRLSSA